ncbi:MAG: hypothetical protein AAF702_13075 [Chloroflexota bacterium]
MSEHPVLQSRLSLDIRDIQLAESYAVELQKVGFEINKVTARGVHFEGPAILYEETFHSKVEISEAGSRFERIPTIPASIDLGSATVYFPNRPTYFPGKRDFTEQDIEQDLEKDIEGDTNDRRNSCEIGTEDEGCPTDSHGGSRDYASTCQTTDS